MAEFGYLRAVIDSFGFAGAKAANRFGQALSDAEGTTYTFQKAATDVFSFYEDMLGAWFGLATGDIISPTPSVTIKIAQGTATASATVPLNLGTAPLDWTALPKIGRPAALGVPKSDVTPAASGTDLKVDLKNLSALKVGLYRGQVFIAATNKPVLEIALRVEP